MESILESNIELTGRVSEFLDSLLVGLWDGGSHTRPFSSRFKVGINRLFLVVACMDDRLATLFIFVRLLLNFLAWGDSLAYSGVWLPVILFIRLWMVGVFSGTSLLEVTRDSSGRQVRLGDGTGRYTSGSDLVELRRELGVRVGSRSFGSVWIESCSE